MAICNLQSRELVFIGASNLIKLVPLSDAANNVNLDMSGVTKVEVCVGAIEADSDTLGDEIAWAEEAVGGVDKWVISLQVGLVPSIVVGEQFMRVTVFDANNTEGLVVTHDFPIDVIADC